MRVRSLGAWAVAGVSLWFSMGALDVTAGPAGPVRVAMLPGFPELGAAVVLAVLAGVAAEHRLSETRRRDIFLPLYSLAVLALPYLPWLPDWLPLLRVFAGPGRTLVWLIVCAQVVWAAVGAGRGPRVVARVRSWGGARSVAAVWIVSAIVSGSAAVVLTSTVLFPGGDEPHYLILAQSIWRDGDLRIENDYARRDQTVLGPEPLEPHSLARGIDGQMYSVHPIGLPLLIAPVMGLVGYPGVVALLVAMAAAASAAAWLWVRQLTGSVSAATFGWGATALSLPFVCGSGLVYPEIPAALLVVLALAVGLRAGAALTDHPDRETDGPARWRMVALGVAVAGLPWLSSKYAPMSAAIMAIGIWRACSATRLPAAQRVMTAACVLLPYGMSLAGWFAFFHLTWGSPWPSAAYGGAAQTQMALSNLVRGLPGTFFDQEYGLLSYAPALAIGAIGLLSMWRAGGRARQTAVELSLVLAALLVTVASHAMWWGGSSVPGRFMLAGLLVLAAPVAWEFRRAAPLVDRRAVYRLLLLVGLAATLVAVGVSDGSILANRRDGVSRLLGWLSPDWHLWAFAPDFIMQGPRLGLLQVGIGLAAILVAFWVFQVAMGRTRGVAVSRVGRGAAFLRANLSALSASLVVTVISPPVLGSALKPDVRPEARGRVAILDSFDPDARRVCLRYDPLSGVTAHEIPGMFVLSARPGSRRAPQPTLVLFNARLALPSGRYRVELQASDSRRLSGQLNLQGGRQSGSALDSWPVEAAPGETWGGSFDLPVDLSFVGFLASPDLSPAIAELRVRPERVVPMLSRTAAYEVIASAVLGNRFVFLFHDGAAYPEGSGFWVRGGAETQVSVVSRTGHVTQAVRLRIRNGEVRNTIRIATPDERTEMHLEPRGVREVTLTPTPLDGTLRMIIGAEGGFVPADWEPGNPDRRVLAAWVEVVG
ncbi:MAG: hypothetical protein AB1806_10825 [Acidobacteriota bacterium]